MQAQAAATHFRRRIAADLARGDQAYRAFNSSNHANLGQLLLAAAAYGAAFELADTACSLVPTREYARIADQRSEAQRFVGYIHETAAGLTLRAAA